MKNKNLTAVGYALCAAVFYALNVPCSKMLLNNIPPVFMAGLLYIGAGLGIGILYLFHYRQESEDIRLHRADIPYTMGMVLLDIMAPIFLMIGIKLGNSSNSSLLGNFEIVATTVIALVIFKEAVSVRLWLAIALITASSIILSFDGSEELRFSLGSIFVIGATILWGFENNCTRRISQKSTYQIVTIKGLCSGAGSLVISAIAGEHISGGTARFVPFALGLGLVSYGLSIFTYIRAQKHLGAAKTSAYYAVAPFIGAALSFFLLGERLSVQYGIAFIVMVMGTFCVVQDTIRRSHLHEHTHTFTHTHDGSTHTHTIVHSHIHSHYIDEGKHTHHHTEKELLEH